MQPSGLDPHPGWTARRVRASGLSVLLALAVIVAVLVARGVFVSARQPIGWVVAAGSVALVMWPVVAAFDRFLPRALAIIVPLVVGVGLVVTVGVTLFVEVRDQLEQLRDTLPAAAADIETERGPDSVLTEIGLADLVRDLVDQVAGEVSPAPVERAAGTAPAFLVSGVLVVFFLVWGRSLLDGAERQITDARRRARVHAVAHRAAVDTQHYVVGAATLAMLVGCVGGLIAGWADLPTPLVLGVILGAASAVPYAGVLFGAMPMLLLAGATLPGSQTLALAIGLVVVQVASTVALRTVVEARSLRVGPAVLVVAVLIGFDVYGTGGALVAFVGAVLLTAVVDATGTADCT